jgi:hypothetical protein
VKRISFGFRIKAVDPASAGHIVLTIPAKGKEKKPNTKTRPAFPAIRRSPINHAPFNQLPATFFTFAL